ncbi:hypothetical protein [Caballeronia catudaia]|uniref:hypothetical protein n=1 Tax=Caballeronia catudaia TaxID=1777136 RepID=UPI00077273D4|nr:hypothetical protein [Caballeronia catudaia]
MIALIASMHGFGMPRTTLTLFCAEIVRALCGHERGGAVRRPVNQGFRKNISVRACKIALLDCKVIAFRGPIIGISVAF